MGIFEDFINECITDCVEGDKHEPGRREDATRPLYKCCSPRCPGYSFRASERPHPMATCAERAGDFK